MENIFVKYPIPGKKYQHYKGGTYEVITLSQHTETKEDLVIYKSLLFGNVYARPLKQWFEKVNSGSEVNILKNESRFVEIYPE